MYTIWNIVLYILHIFLAILFEGQNNNFRSWTDTSPTCSAVRVLTAQEHGPKLAEVCMRQAARLEELQDQLEKAGGSFRAFFPADKFRRCFFSFFWGTIMGWLVGWLLFGLDESLMLTLGRVKSSQMVKNGPTNTDNVVSKLVDHSPQGLEATCFKPRKTDDPIGTWELFWVVLKGVAICGMVFCQARTSQRMAQEALETERKAHALGAKCWKRNAQSHQRNATVGKLEVDGNILLQRNVYVTIRKSIQTVFWSYK